MLVSVYKVAHVCADVEDRVRANERAPTKMIITFSDGARKDNNFGAKFAKIIMNHNANEQNSIAKFGMLNFCGVVYFFFSRIYSVVARWLRISSSHY